jgi:serine/threonine-protein kinase HipA
MKLAMAIGTNRHYTVDTITGRHFVQTAKASGLPDKMVADLIGELHDTAAKGIDKARAALPKDFPEKVARSIADGAKARAKSLAIVDSKD